MAFTPETVQSRARNLRTEAVKAASVMRGHVARVDATIAVLLSAVSVSPAPNWGWLYSSL